MKKAMLSLLIALLLLIPCPPSRAGTLVLYEGSVLVGKIISDDGTWVHLKNYHGTFRIKKNRIDDIYQTQSYREDIALHRRLKLPYNENDIIINYRAGQVKATPSHGEEKAPEPIGIEPPDERKEPAGKTDKWTSGRISLSGSFLNRVGSGSATLRDGYAVHVALDQGLDFRPGGRHPMIPGLRLEASYLQFRKATRSLSGVMAVAGPIWAFPSMKNRRGCFILALMPGASVLKARSHDPFAGGNVGAGGINFGGQAIAGYQKSFGPVSIFLLGRYVHILGKKGGFISAGGEAGIGINAW